MGSCSAGGGMEINQAFANEYLFTNTVHRLFPKTEFELLYIPYNRNDLDGHLMRETRDPEFKFRHRASGLEFWVACRFCGGIHCHRVRWCDGYQLDRYRWFQTNVRPEAVYIVIGVGGEGNKPDNMYCVPLDLAKHPAMDLDSLSPYKHEFGTSMRYIDGRLRQVTVSNRDGVEILPGCQIARTDHDILSRPPDGQRRL